MSENIVQPPNDCVGTPSVAETSTAAKSRDENEDPTTNRRVKFSESSETLLAESRRLLEMRPSQTLDNGDLRSSSVSALAESMAFSPSSSGRYSLHTPRFPRIDFDNLVDEQIGDRKPAWKQLQDSVQDSYYKAKRSVERKKDETEFLDQQLQRRRSRRSESPFAYLDTDRPSRRSLGSSLYSSSVSDIAGASINSLTHTSLGPYAAPAVGRSHGIESSYERRANDIEARLLRTSLLPDKMKMVTTREFRRAPHPAPGSACEAAEDDVDYQSFMPRPYYSRPNRDDPDYFDFDLQHSVNMFKRPEGRYVPKGPQEWETKLLGGANAKGETPISSYLFTKGDSDWRGNGTSFLSAALRTPAFWERRFTSIGQQVRDRNPVSLDSLNRSVISACCIEQSFSNKPLPNRFTEYRDPDFEDYEDPRDD